MLKILLRRSIFSVFVIFLLVVSVGAGFASEGDFEDRVRNFIKSVIPEQENIVYLSSKINESKPFIEEEVYELIEKEGKTAVIIYLSNEGLDFNNAELMREQIRERQDNVLNSLMREISGPKKQDSDIIENDAQDNLEVLLANNKLDSELDNSVIDSRDVDEIIKDELIINEKPDSEIVNHSNEIIINNEKEERDKEKNFELIYRYVVVNGLSGTINKKGLGILKDNEYVESIYAERILHAAMNESARLINADDAWNIHIQQNGAAGPNVTGLNQIVCVVDTGVDYTHPDLGGCIGQNCKVLDGYNFINNTNNPMDYFGHGTHVAGIAAANGNVKGVAPDAKILATKVCINENSCPGSAIIAGVDWCMNQHLNNYDVDVITMSLGDGGQYTNTNCPTWMNNAFAITSIYGIPVTAASGNEGYNNGISYPACNQNVISVGAVYDANVGPQNWISAQCTDSTTAPDKVACFSNTGNNLDVIAPGAMITSTWINHGILTIGGTSMAAPHSAGTIALIKQVNDIINPSQIEYLLKQNGKKVIDFDNGINFSRIDAANIINKLVAPRWDNDIRLTYANFVSTWPAINIDSQDFAHITWRDSRVGNYEIYYKKIDNYGNAIVNDKRISFNPADSREPSIGTDSQGNAHIIWDDFRDGEIYYSKIDGNGNTAVNEKRITFLPGGSTGPDLAMDAQGNVHVAWMDRTPSGYALPEIYYLKLNNTGNTIVNEKRISFSIAGAFNPNIKTDNSGNVYITWSDFRHANCAVSSLCNTELYYAKLDNNGNIILNETRLTFGEKGSGKESLDIDSQNNIHLIWADDRHYTFTCVSVFLGFCDHDIFYKKIDSSGNILINDTLIAKNYTSPKIKVDNYDNINIYYNQKPSNTDTDSYKNYNVRFDAGFNKMLSESLIPLDASALMVENINSFSVDLDSKNNAHIVWPDFRHNQGVCMLPGGPCNNEIYYKRSYPQISVDIYGVPSPGNTVTLELQDEMNRNQQYISGFSGAATIGIPLPDGRNIPLNPDILLTQSVYYPNTLGIVNSWGNLDNSGRANVTLTIPNSPITGISVYGGFVTIDNSNPNFLGISNAFKMTFV